MAAKVSVIIPTYNRVKLLDYCLRSVLYQTHRDLEAIVIDDGSSDGTSDFLHRAADKDARLKIFSQDHRGAQAARNLGYEKSTGEFVSFLDDDDLWHPQKTEKQLDTFKQTTDGVVCQTVWFRSWPGDHNFLFNEIDERDFLARFLMLDVVWQTAAPLWRKSFLDKVGPWDERLTSGQDLDFHTRCLCFQPKLEILPDVLNFFREHAGTRITKDRKEEHPANALYAMENAHRLLRHHGLLNDQRGEAIASTVMRQSRTLALYGEKELTKQCLEIALDTHPSAKARGFIKNVLGPLDGAILNSRGLKPLARAFRKTAQGAMYAFGVERRRVSWWQQHSFSDRAAIEGWKTELAPLATPLI